MAALGTIGRGTASPVSFWRVLYVASVRTVLAGKLSGSITDQTGTGIARKVRAYVRSTGVPVGETTSDGSGAYSLPAMLGAEHHVVAMDDDGSPLENDQVARTIAPSS